MIDIAFLLLVLSAISLLVASVIGNIAANQLERFLNDYPRFRFVKRRTKLIVFATLFVVLSIPSIYIEISSQPSVPSRMPDGNFNIAVAEFSLLNEMGQLTRSREARELSQSIANFLQQQEDDLAEVLAESVFVWGPNNNVRPVEPREEAKRAITLNADALIYGVVRPESDDSWNVQPMFYLTDSAVGQANEMRGEYALGSKILYRPNNAASRRDINNALRIRTEALSQLLIGLSYLSFGDFEGYEKAAEVLQSAAENSEWAVAADDTGQEILYLFLGNAYLQQSFLTDDESPQRSELLNRSEKAFATAINLNSSYARSYNGLGSVLFQKARALAIDAECDWQWDFLDRAADNYESALNSPDSAKPESGQVDYRANFGLGRVNFWLGYCLDKTKWEDAEKYYQSVVNEYEQMMNPIPHLTDIAAYAHTDLATMALIRANSQTEEVESSEDYLSRSIIHYQTSVELTNLSKTEDGARHAKESMPYYLTALCLDGESKTAMSTLEEFVNSYAANSFLEDYIVSQTPIWKECIDDIRK